VRRLLRFEYAKEQPIWLRVLSLLVLVLALGNVLQFLPLAGLRLFYPFEIEWMEGASIDEIRWILAGNSLYSAPSISFIPAFYNPFYFFLSAALMKLIGVGFVASRLLSILSTTGCFLVLFLISSEASGHPISGLVAAGIYAATFRFAGAWMDIARTDSLFLFLVLFAFFVGRKYSNRRGMVISALLYVLAYYTKQTALFVILIVAPLSLVAYRGRTWPQWLTAAFVGLVFWVLDSTSNAGILSMLLIWQRIEQGIETSGFSGSRWSPRCGRPCWSSCSMLS